MPVWQKNSADAESLWQSGFQGVGEQDSRPTPVPERREVGVVERKSVDGRTR